MKRPTLWIFGPLAFVAGYPTALCQHQVVLAKAQVNPHSTITKVNVKVIRSISTSMTMSQILKRLGKPEKDAGSGIYILQWRGTDGSVLSVGTVDLRSKAKPQYVVLEPPRLQGKSKTQQHQKRTH